MRWAGRLCWLAPAVGAGPAHAHAPIPGIEGFYTGLLHPFSTPAQALLMLGLGLLAGSFDSQRVRWPLGAFLAATLVGVGLGRGPEGLDAALFATAFAAAAWAALAPGRFLPGALVVALVGGVLIAMVSVPDPGPTRDRVITLAGSLVGANLGLLYLAGLTLLARQRDPRAWVRIGLRVAAAWVGAISLLMLALSFAPGDMPA